MKHAAKNEFSQDSFRMTFRCGYIFHGNNVLALFLEDFRLKLNRGHCYIFPSHVGRRFLGQRVFCTHRLLLAENVRSFKRRQQSWQKSPPENLPQRLASWQGHAEQADTFGLLQALGLIEASPPTTEIMQLR